MATTALPANNEPSNDHTHETVKTSDTRPPTNEKANFWAMGGACYLIVLQILAMPDRDIYLTASLYCSAVAIPFDIFVGSLWRLVTAEQEGYKSPTWLNYMLLVAMVSTFTSLVCVFMHFSIGMGMTFALSGVLCIVVAQKLKRLWVWRFRSQEVANETGSIG